MLSARLLLVRHGESTWNRDHRLQGQADPPLSERGRAEAAALRESLEGFPAERVVASDLERARETAALLGHRDPELDPRWREVDVGEWQGRDLRELPEGPEPSWRGGPLVPPGGETWDEMAARVTGAVEELRACGGSWLVVCHGGPIRAATAHLTSASARRLAAVANASVTAAELDGQGRLLTYSWTPAGRPAGI